MTRDIRINPKLGSTSSNDFPTIDFGGLSSSSISLKVEDDGSVIYTGTYGTLFSITDNKDGLLHSVNDISGLPILQVHSNDYVQLGKWDKYTLVANSDKVGIGLTAPSTKFHIYATQSGAFRLQDGTQNTGYVLTSDSNGVATWTQSSNVFNGGTGSFGVVFSKGDGTITTSDTAKLVIPFGGYITGWRILEISSTPVSSSIVVDVKKTTYDNYPSSFSSIAGSEKPTLSSVVKNQDTTLTTWTTSFEAGDIFEFDVESVTSAKNVSVMLMYVRTINL